MDGQSLNLTEERITQLKSLFPDAVSEGKVDFDRLKAALGEHLANPRDRYELSWAGKAEARKEVQKQTSATLLPDRESSVDFDTSENIFIEGENLEALRILQKSYFGKVKMIYIDPPYNTGNDSFVYPDDYSERKEEYERRTGIKDEGGYLNKQDLWKKNTKESGQFHSVWLSMMFPRLYMARNLLREDGVIFVSIDDHEQGNLKLLMDEVFGKENFVATFVWRARAKPTNAGNAKYRPQKISEYVLAYSGRNVPESLKFNVISAKNRVYPHTDSKGKYRTTTILTSNRGMFRRETMRFEIANFKPDEEQRWKAGKEAIQEYYNNGRIGFNDEGTPYLKHYEEEEDDALYPFYTFIHPELSSTAESGKAELNELLGRNHGMDTVKPVSLLKYLIQTVTNEGDLIADFFAGSGTTAHAVLELNIEDGGNRKFILAQLPEAIEEGSEAYKAGYRTIADISKARIQKVIAKIKAQQATQLDFKDKQQDLGFKAYRVAPSNFKVWQQDVQGAGAIATQLEVFQNPYREGTNEENMLYELMLKSGLPLTATVEEKETEGLKYYLVNGDRVFALRGVSSSLIQAVEALKPLVFITLDKHFANQDQLMSNTQLQLREAGVEFRVI